MRTKKNDDWMGVVSILVPVLGIGFIAGWGLTTHFHNCPEPWPVSRVEGNAMPKGCFIFERYGDRNLWMKVGYRSSLLYNIDFASPYDLQRARDSLRVAREGLARFPEWRKVVEMEAELMTLRSSVELWRVRAMSLPSIRISTDSMGVFDASITRNWPR
jgi:hypothetical protein